MADGEEPEPVQRLDDRVTELEALVEALRAQNAQMKKVLAGSADAWSAWNADNMTPFVDRLDDLETSVEDFAHNHKLLMSGDAKQATPDERALRLRQVLLNSAEKRDGGYARMDRDTAEKVLDGSLHNYSVLDAMRRAANGRSGNIHGTSGLDPIDGITFTTGSEASRNGRPDISILEIDVDDVPNTDRQHIVLMARSEGVAD